MINTILFDLDGTLLKMDQDAFVSRYFRSIAQQFRDIGEEKMIHAIQYGTMAMLKNDGKETNETVFWRAFAKIVPEAKELDDRFMLFYKTEFQKLIALTEKQPLAKKIVKGLKEKGYDVVCCTNPLFPAIATHSRIEWAGLSVDDFSHITTFENSGFCKPNIHYYYEVLEKLNKAPEECMMVGNDVSEDLVVKKMNMITYLVEDNMINNKNIDIETDYRGSFEELYHFFKTIPERN